MAKRTRKSARINTLLNKLNINKPIPIMEMPRLWKTAEKLVDAGATDTDITFAMTPLIDAITVNTTAN